MKNQNGDPKAVPMYGSRGNKTVRHRLDSTSMKMVRSTRIFRHLVLDHSALAKMERIRCETKLCVEVGHKGIHLLAKS